MEDHNCNESLHYLSYTTDISHIYDNDIEDQNVAHNNDNNDEANNNDNAIEDPNVALNNDNAIEDPNLEQNNDNNGNDIEDPNLELNNDNNGNDIEDPNLELNNDIKENILLMSSKHDANGNITHTAIKITKITNNNNIFLIIDCKHIAAEELIITYNNNDAGEVEANALANIGINNVDQIINFINTLQVEDHHMCVTIARFFHSDYMDLSIHYEITLMPGSMYHKDFVTNIDFFLFTIQVCEEIAGNYNDEVNYRIEFSLNDRVINNWINLYRRLVD